MEEDLLVIIPEFIERLEKLDFYIWVKAAFSEEFIPPIGTIAEYSVPVPDKLDEKEVYNANDVAIVFGCGRQKAYRIMKLMSRYDCTVTLGREIYTTKEKLLEFMNCTMGQSFVLTD